MQLTSDPGTRSVQPFHNSKYVISKSLFSGPKVAGQDLGKAGRRAAIFLVLIKERKKERKHEKGVND